MRKHILIAAAISISLSIALWLAVGRSYRLLAQQRPNPRSDTLRSRAERDGSATANAWPTNLHKYDTVDALARESNAIAIASAVSKASQLLPPAEKFIVTDIEFTIRDSFKGALTPGQIIRVRTPGGRVDLGAGKYAEVSLPGFWKDPEVGKLYVVFLESRTDGTFVLRGGPQGLFEITPSEIIKAQVRPEDKLSQNYDGTSLISFLKEIRKTNK